MSRKTTSWAARSDTGLVRERNEDRWLTRAYAGTLLLAVADGVGGEPGGALASETAVAALGRAFAPPGFNESARSALGAAVQEANRAVLSTAGDPPGSAGPAGATTLVAAAVRGREAAIANLGDSRAYLVRAGAARQLTTDHRGDRPHSITRFLGDPRGVQPDIFVETLERGDRLVLCSDGLTLHVGAEEIAGLTVGAPAAAADALVALAKKRGGEDNVTVVIYAAPLRPAKSGLVGTIILALLLALVVAGALAAVFGAPANAPAPSPSPGVSPIASPSP